MRPIWSLPSAGTRRGEAHDGRARDFDFLHGAWNTRQRRLRTWLAESDEWDEFEATMVDLRLKGERFYDALTHPGQGRDSRRVMGERDVERR